MTLARIFGLLVVSSLLATGAALARSTSDPAVVKADRAQPKNASASAKRVRPQAPIVMGRSVSERRKTKLHHLKVKPLESIEDQGDR